MMSRISKFIFDNKIKIQYDLRRAWKMGVFKIGVSSFLVRFTALAQRILLARILGAENIGHIAVITSALSIFRLPAGAGTFTVVNKLIAENNENRKIQKQIIGSAFHINAFTTLVISIIAWLILTYTDLVNDLVANHYLRILVFLLPIIIFTEVLRNALLGLRRMGSIALIDIGLSLLAIFIVIPMAYLWSINGWFINQILIILLGCGLFVWILKPIISFKGKSEITKKLVQIGFYAFLGQLMGTFVTQFDTLAVSYILKNANLTGIYNTASMVALQMVIIPGAVLTVVFPYVAQNKSDIQKLQEKYWELLRKVGGLALTVTAISWIISPWLFPVFGPEFENSVGPFRILILGFIARSLYILDNTYLDALGRTDITFLSGIVSALLTIVLNLTFIPKWELLGAAWATTISMFVSFIIRQIAVYYFIFKKNEIR